MSGSVEDGWQCPFGSHPVSWREWNAVVYNNMLASFAIEAGVYLQRKHVTEKRTLGLEVPHHRASLPGVHVHPLQDRRRRRPSVT